jgi:hypothetical protein
VIDLVENFFSDQTEGRGQGISQLFKMKEYQTEALPPPIVIGDARIRGDSSHAARPHNKDQVSQKFLVLGVQANLLCHRNLTAYPDFGAGHMGRASHMTAVAQET